MKERKTPGFLKGQETYDSRQIGKMAHIEVMSDGRMVLFDYRKRSLLNHNAKAVIIGMWDACSGCAVWQEVAEKDENRSCING